MRIPRVLVLGGFGLYFGLIVAGWVMGWLVEATPLGWGLPVLLIVAGGFGAALAFWLWQRRWYRVGGSEFAASMRYWGDFGDEVSHRYPARPRRRSSLEPPVSPSSRIRRASFSRVASDSEARRVFSTPEPSPPEPKSPWVDFMWDLFMVMLGACLSIPISIWIEKTV